VRADQGQKEYSHSQQGINHDAVSEKRALIKRAHDPMSTHRDFQLIGDDRSNQMRMAAVRAVSPERESGGLKKVDMCGFLMDLADPSHLQGMVDEDRNDRR
jgi:hypothetical protein